MSFYLITDHSKTRQQSRQNSSWVSPFFIHLRKESKMKISLAVEYQTSGKDLINISFIVEWKK
jgi:hypothetical protein